MKKHFWSLSIGVPQSLEICFLCTSRITSSTIGVGDSSSSHNSSSTCSSSKEEISSSTFFCSSSPSQALIQGQPKPIFLITMH